MAARRRDKLEGNAKLMKHPLILPTDLSDEKQARGMIEKTVKHFGRIDVLINNAASIIVSRSDELKSEDLLKAYNSRHDFH
jgi:NADP-dependent 3-hydroxy acid dehydrogenase YdfG